jgi:hypothetical protein
MNANKSNASNSIPVIWIIGVFALLVIGGLIIAQATPAVFPPQGSRSLNS